MFCLGATWTTNPAVTSEGRGPCTRNNVCMLVPANGFRNVYYVLHRGKLGSCASCSSSRKEQRAAHKGECLYIRSVRGLNGVYYVLCSGYLGSSASWLLTIHPPSGGHPRDGGVLKLEGHFPLHLDRQHLDPVDTVVHHACMPAFTHTCETPPIGALQHNHLNMQRIAPLDAIVYNVASHTHTRVSKI